MQGRKALLDFSRNIEILAARVPAVDEFQKCHRLFEGANGYF